MGILAVSLKPERIYILIIVFLLGACSTTPDEKTESPAQQSHFPENRNAIPSPEPEKVYTPAIGSTAKRRTADTTGYNDIWIRIQDNLEFERYLARSRVQNKLTFYDRKQGYLDRVADRATPYIHYIVEQLDKRGMPLDLALLPIVESAYQPFAYSRSHAAGIWQFIPGTGRHYGLKQNWWYDGRRDIVAATDAALTYLQRLHDLFNGDWMLAVAAYNGGERTIQRAMERNRKDGKPTDFWSLNLRRETMHYVPSLLAVAEIVARPQKYNIALKSIPNKPYFEIIDVGSQIDMAIVADITGVDREEIRILNPGIKKWATDPEGPHHLLLPLHKAEIFRQKLASLPESDRVKWLVYRIREGDTLGKIARQYRLDVSALKQANKLDSHLIRAGHTLAIPTSNAAMATADTVKRQDDTRHADRNSSTYTVRPGDSLWNISRRFDTSINDLCRWNEINRRTVLKPGDTLVIQSRHSETQLLAASNNSGNQRVSYTVQSGDSLWLIARRFDVTVEQIQHWNSMQQQTSLKPGQNLEIYVEQSPADV